MSSQSEIGGGTRRASEHDRRPETLLAGEGDLGVAPDYGGVSILNGTLML
jgi:hypothetical protein